MKFLSPSRGSRASSSLAQGALRPLRARLLGQEDQRRTSASGDCREVFFLDVCFSDPCAFPRENEEDLHLEDDWGIGTPLYLENDEERRKNLPEEIARFLSLAQRSFHLV